jgi:hypothetical protein
LAGTLLAITPFVTWDPELAGASKQFYGLAWKPSFGRLDLAWDLGNKETYFRVSHDFSIDAGSLKLEFRSKFTESKSFIGGLLVWTPNN